MCVCVSVDGLPKKTLTQTQKGGRVAMGERGIGAAAGLVEMPQRLQPRRLITRRGIQLMTEPPMQQDRIVRAACVRARRSPHCTPGSRVGG